MHLWLVNSVELKECQLGSVTDYGLDDWLQFPPESTTPKPTPIQPSFHF
jgi:hypothetical protein